MPFRCTTIPGTPGRPGRKSRIEIQPNLGWNSGARSVAMIDGPCRLAFTMPKVTGAACGLATARRGTNPAGIDFALQFETSGAGAVFRAIESGRPVSEWASYVRDSTLFTIDRLWNGRLVAKADGVTVAQSAAIIDSPLVTVGCLYAATDQIG